MHKSENFINLDKKADLLAKEAYLSNVHKGYEEASSEITRETIVSAAVWLKDGKEYDYQPINIKKGFVVQGRSHAQCLHLIKAMTSLTKGSRDQVKYVNFEQGFITSNFRWVDRVEARQIAMKNKQLLTYNNAHSLYSEDIFPSIEYLKDSISKTDTDPEIFLKDLESNVKFVDITDTLKIALLTLSNYKDGSLVMPLEIENKIREILTHLK